MELEYVTVYGSEQQGTGGNYGIKIQIAAGRTLTKEETYSIREYSEKITAMILGNTIALNPENIENAVMEKRQLLALFPSPIYFEAIPNGYCSDYCCKNKPWFIVTTHFGRIKIGWRKRVISIDWSDSKITKTAEELFPLEEVTKDGKLIHAYGYEKAKEYIDVLLGYAAAKQKETIVGIGNLDDWKIE